MFKLIENKMVVPNLHQITVEAPEIAAAVEPGQFVIIRPEEDGERIPLTVSDWDRDKGTITIVFMNVGKTTDVLSSLPVGVSLATVVGPLGKNMEIDLYGTALCIGGCYGIASIYPIAKALKEKGNTVITMVEARSAYLLYWLEKLRNVSDKMVIITRDGSRGIRGHINRLPEILTALKTPVNRVIINGCNYLMMRGSEETRPFEIPTIVSLNTLMIDGTGMCGVCRVTVDSKTLFACVDGPHFDGHLVDWEELAQRRKGYLKEEVLPVLNSRPYHNQLGIRPPIISQT
ncbi:MAG: sulfide/dihydroorotate dehydrogenase-like FAD/NAD-binding protein [Anaerolineales bacterium]|nr:sulfide/dihydroorotate dehydrogenase-like FAD/NAD-binding protein [Anaerolineales bacterium]